MPLGFDLGNVETLLSGTPHSLISKTVCDHKEKHFQVRGKFGAGKLDLKYDGRAYPTCVAKAINQDLVSTLGLHDLVESNDRDLLRLLVDLIFSWAEGFLNCLV